jgi:hypothetical protein
VILHAEEPAAFTQARKTVPPRESVLARRFGKLNVDPDRCHSAVVVTEQRETELVLH